MTRANLNFVWQNNGESPRTLFAYWNGDQYPAGLRDIYKVADFVNKPTPWTPEDFKEWIKTNYGPENVEDFGEEGQPKIYYTDGYITDYSYVFEAGGKVKVWNWAKLVFDGTAQKFLDWLKKQ